MYDYIAHIEEILPEVLHDYFEDEITIINPLQIVYKGVIRHPIDKNQIAVYQVKVWATESVLSTDNCTESTESTESTEYKDVFFPRNLEIYINTKGMVVDAELV